ncbi:MAG TPA: NAD(P)H-hydrate dehydratase [Steroidobacteraceae bacterium]|nr:NAD(P)H-hydrate dehydratase [Steroidobacteraceae bacterium]
MAKLPLHVYTEAQIRALDRLAIDHLGIPSYTLMTRAGEAGLRALRSYWPATERVVVLCGPGNNAGDGYVLASAALQQRMDVRVVALSDPEKLNGDAKRAWQEFRAAGGVATEWQPDLIDGVDVIVDAIFGVGLSRDVEPHIASCIQCVNASSAHVLSLDIPSGIAADSGRILGSAIQAERTISFLGLKLGFYLGDGPNYTGFVMCDELDVPRQAFEQLPAMAMRIDEDTVARTLPRRHRTTHKGQQGHVLLIGGGSGMGGAARLAGEAALRVGSGLVTVATKPENTAAITSGRPELICRGITRADELEPLIERADVVAIGPGLGLDEWALEMMRGVSECKKPSVIDADALNTLGQFPRANTNWILTPHPGEAGRLLGISAAEVQADRLHAATEICARYGGVVVLKGAGTLVVNHDELPHICDRGNPGMASPGMGDVLTGVIAGILAQRTDLVSAARTGVLIHAMAGDMAAHRGERGLIASDLFNYLPTCANPH